MRLKNPGSSGSGGMIGDYVILGELGRGSMGIVYKAKDPSLERIVAIKVLSDRLSGDEEFIERFQQEARAAAQLNHPNIVTIHQISYRAECPFIVMEYVDGIELS